MSGFDKKTIPGQPPSEAAADDPWAKWRKPTETPAVDVAKPAKARPAAEPVVTAAAEPAVKREKPVGTLGVNKDVAPSPRAPNRKPLRGGPPPRQTASAKYDATGSKKAPVAKSAPLAKPAPAPRPERDPTAPPPEGVRLSKVMSERGMCSRREADLWIERGWVFVDGERVSELGTRIKADAEISISKEAKHDQAKQVTVLLNKPVGYVSGQPEPGFTPAITLITADNQLKQSGDPEFKPWMLRSLAPSGRLDIDSTGLLVLTQDGRVAKKLIGDDSQVEKEYLVRVAGEMIKGGLELLNHGLELDGQALKPARVKQLNEDQLHFILKEGKKRQIRRMCELVGLRVIGLKRVRIGRVKLGDLEIGQWRFLRADEAF